jgi:hypothetical protein
MKDYSKGYTKEQVALALNSILNDMAYIKYIGMITAIHVCVDKIFLQMIPESDEIGLIRQCLIDLRSEGNTLNLIKE